MKYIVAIGHKLRSGNDGVETQRHGADKWEQVNSNLPDSWAPDTKYGNGSAQCRGQCAADVAGEAEMTFELQSCKENRLLDAGVTSL
jgi:hypothetical protein